MAHRPNAGPRRLSWAAAAASIALILGGCANTVKEPPLYGWRNYEKNLDAHFRSDKSSPDDQLRSMLDDRQQIEAASQALPPGYRAHLGLLYGRRGDLEGLRQNIEAEKQQFPESSGFMDFLLRNFKSK